MIFTGIVCDSCMLAVCFFSSSCVCFMCNSVCGMMMREEMRGNNGGEALR